MESEQTLGKRHFRKLTDIELRDWRPVAPRGWFGWDGTAGVNVGRANREMRIRAKTAAFGSVYDWLATIGDSPQAGDRVEGLQ